LISALGFLCIDFAQRKAHVDDDLVADSGFRHEVQLNQPRDSTKLHSAKPAAILFRSLKNLPGNCQTHA
jgi:hypothetical protein